MTCRPRPRALASVPLLLALALTGCGATESAGAAAVIDARRIPVPQLQSSTQQLLEAARTSGAPTGADLDPATAQRGVLTQLIRADLLQETATRSGVSISDGEVDTLLREIEQQAGSREALEQQLIEAAVPPQRLRETVRTIALQNAMVERLAPQATSPEEGVEALRQRLTETAQSLGVEVNPRYGTWDPEQLAVAGSPSGGLATPLTPASP